MNIIKSDGKGKPNKVEIFIDDLTEKAANQLIEFFNGDNGNYDVMPLAILEFEPEKE